MQIIQIFSYDDKNAYEAALDFLMVLRVGRIFKIFHAIPRFRIVINTIIHILPSFATYGCLLFVVFYFFAILGMELFGGKFKFDSANQFCGNPKLNVSSRVCFQLLGSVIYIV